MSSRVLCERSECKCSSFIIKALQLRPFIEAFAGRTRN